MIPKTQPIHAKLAFITLLLVQAAAALATDPHQYSTPAGLGEALFFDISLSQRRTQSCATCHAPGRAFVDTRPNAVGGAVSLGDDGISLGTRNAPTLGYAALTPAFHVDHRGDYVGGFFYDGRAADLVEQAAGPLVDPREMALAGPEMLTDRILENPGYAASLRYLFGDAVFTDSNKVHQSVAKSIAAFVSTPQFSPFDSKYDRYLRGEYTLSADQDRGRLVYFSSLINCNSCHLLDQPGEETFTDYSYHNIGVPENPALRADRNRAQPDQGLLDNSLVNDPAQRGKFKVPTLRNIAVTAPYMHNGVFKDLRTVVTFYNKYLISSTRNPETGKPWREPEVDDNISTDLLKQGQPMNEHRIDALIAFLETLTDQRYESLLETPVESTVGSEEHNLESMLTRLDSADAPLQVQN